MSDTEEVAKTSDVEVEEDTTAAASNAEDNKQEQENEQQEEQEEEEEEDSGPKLFYARDDAKDAHGVKLIDVKKGELEVDAAGRQLLEKIGEQDPLNLCFVFGNARSGKSFLMNCLLGVRGVFKVINSSTPCTRGVDMSSHIVKQSALAAMCEAEADSGADASDPMVGFVDVEGQGAEDGTYDTMLALPLLLTSRVVLFNHKGAPTVNDMLSKLGVLATAARYIDLDEPEDEDKEDADAAAVFRQRSHSSLVAQKKFGHLHVVFRDFAFSGSKEDVYQQLLGKEKVVKSLKKSNEAKGAEERNNIRDLLIENFQSINVWLLKQPASADELMKHPELPEELIDPSFKVTVRELLHTITGQLATPTMFAGSKLTGPRVSSLLGTIADALNKGGLINVPSVYRAMETETVHRIAGECLATFTKFINQIRVNDLPTDSKALDNKISQGVENMLDKFDNDLLECVLEEEKKSSRENIESQANTLAESLRRANEDAAVLRVREVVDRHMTDLRSKFLAWCEENIPVKKGQEIDDKCLELTKTALQGITQDLSDLPQAKSLEEFQRLVDDAKKSMDSLLSLKKIDNESQLKDRTIERLRQEALRQQAALQQKQQELEEFLRKEREESERLKRELEQQRKEREAAEREQEEKLRRLQAAQQAAPDAQKKRCVIL